MRFEYLVTNNDAEYEIAIMGLRLTARLRVSSIKIYDDFQLVVEHVIVGMTT